jgi:hypothetical protein
MAVTQPPSRHEIGATQLLKSVTVNPENLGKLLFFISIQEPAKYQLSTLSVNFRAG